jgi:hypothetical protein
MPHRSSLSYLATVTLLLSACATAPAPKAASAPKVAPAPSGIRKITLLCGDKARAALFDQLGVPAGERPVDVAVTDKYIWVLFEPARLLRIVRKGEKIDVEMTVGHGDERWSGLAVDPADDSVWVTSDKKLAFVHIFPDWKSKTLPLQKVVGEGGFRELLVADDALYARPTSAEKLIWRIDRTGKVLDTAFDSKEPSAASLAVGQVHDYQSLEVRLLRDGLGHVLVWDAGAGKVFQADGKGGWTERDDIHWFDHDRGRMTVRGVNIGGKDELWYMAGEGRGQLFYWKGRPVFLGPYGWGERSASGQIFYVPGGGNVATSGDAAHPVHPADDVAQYLEVCHGNFLSRVASNATSYAAITDKAVLFGDFVDAPDLP